jgi:chemotaxis protein methyltransferase CheR
MTQAESLVPIPTESPPAVLPPAAIPPAALAAVSFGRLAEVTDEELARYAELIYQRTGIRISPQKKTLLSNRLRRRLRETGSDGFGAYYEYLRRLPPGDPEWDAFLQEITTHETFLFRDTAQWEWFRKEYLPWMAAEARAGRRPPQLHIWSAACSTGDEAFTAACCVADVILDHANWQIRILGTDIGLGALEQARTGVFGPRAMRLAPENYKRRFFRQIGPDRWQAAPQLARLITFRQHNLLERLREGPFDLVFLKNVLIYFAPESKRRVMENVRAVIRPGGFLVSGPAEGISDFVRDFARLRPWLCQRPPR